ncbi:MAG: DUF4625 domain-containing protein [Phaeodactylibacter xiamenensis]|jgi:hypothetical protein|uniref:DUF4625 domain-containing protein n=1 Tax=Phaeodactylibacter xiamenensis TaxID=1524460 RepID=UPI00069786FF|nr:DUF4625 domain-containing protein [Phaeodactylibacter xiamenensis]
MDPIKTFFAGIVLIALLAWSCNGSDDVDVSAPSMQVISFAPAPEPGAVCGGMEDSVFTVLGGETLTATLRFSDDRSLSQYKVDIHNNFDCHGHGGAAAPGVAVPNVSNQTEDWTVLDIRGLSGETAEEQLQLPVPTDVTSGIYHFQIQVIDEAGNDNPLANFYSIRAINPTDGEAPTLTLSSPSQVSFTAAKGSTVTFSGTVTDNYSLSEGGNGIVFLSYTDLSSGNTFSTGAYVAFDAGVEKDYNFDFEYTIPQTLKAGNYRFRVDAHDGVRNTAEPVIFGVVVTD